MLIIPEYHYTIIAIINKSTQHLGHGFDSQFSESWNSYTKSSGTIYGKQLPRTSSTCISGPAEAVKTEELYKQSAGWGVKMLRSCMINHLLLSVG